MTEAEQQLFLIKGMVASMSAEDQIEIGKLSAQIRTIVDDAGPLGLITATLVVSQLAAENDD